MPQTDIKRLDARGASFIEVLIALAIVVVMAVLVLPFFANQRKIINQYEPTGLCQGYLSRAAARLESGGAFATEAPDFMPIANTLSSPGDWANVPEIFYAPDSKRVSFNPDNPRTFSDRFTEMAVPKSGSKFLLYKTRPGQTYKRYDGRDIPAEADGILLYTPLLIKGSVADVADLYNNPIYHANFSPAPKYIIGKEGVIDPRYVMDIEMRVDRVLLKDRTISNTSNRFWPVARNAVGNMDPSDTSKYRISTVEDTILKSKGAGPFFAVAQIPQIADGIEMSWDYGFKVSFRGKLKEVASGTISDCNHTQEYFLPSDFHNVISFRSDFDFLTTPVPGTPQEVVTSKLSSKFDSYTTMTADPTFLSIFFGTNFGSDASGTPNARFGKNRPECSQDGTKTKTFEFRLSFKNLNKEPGAIPVCMDTSVRPADLSTNDGSDYIWCSGGINSQTRITNDFLPGQTGFVPCEKMRFCGQTPQQVTFTNTTDSSGNVISTYTYQYTIRNDGNASRNRLWGCDVSYSAAIIDPSGNLSYVPKAENGALAETSDVLGINRPFISSLVPKIYFKPPPCYSCKCKPAKSGKSPFLKILGFIAFAVAVYFAAIYLGPAMMSVNPAFGFSSALLTDAAIGVVLTGIATCMLQSAGMTGGKCAPNNSLKDKQGDYRACKSQNSPTCSNGFTCNNVAAPPAANFDTDLPAGFTDDSALGYCSYEVKTRTTPVGSSTKTWLVELGGRKVANGPVDSTAVINFSDPNPKLNPDSAYIPINGTANYTMLDKQNGLYCFSQWKCTWNGSHGEWRLDSGTIDGIPGTNYEACWNIKAGIDLNFRPDGTVTPGAPVCLKVETDPAEMQLQPCTAFDIACYNGTQIHDITALSLDFGGISKIAGKRTNAAATVFAGNLPVEKRDAKCVSKVADCGPNHCAAPPLSGPYTPGDGNTYQRNNSCDPTQGPPEGESTYVCPLACSLSGSSCVANNSSFGSCTYNAPIPPIPPATVGTPASCTPSPATCYRRTFNVFDYWFGCQPPLTLQYHMKNANTGMMCFGAYNTSLSSLPMCWESGSLTSNPPDMICPGGSQCL